MRRSALGIALLLHAVVIAALILSFAPRPMRPPEEQPVEVLYEPNPASGSASGQDKTSPSQDRAKQTPAPTPAQTPNPNATVAPPEPAIRPTPPPLPPTPETQQPQSHPQPQAQPQPPPQPQPEPQLTAPLSPPPKPAPPAIRPRLDLGLPEDLLQPAPPLAVPPASPPARATLKPDGRRFAARPAPNPFGGGGTLFLPNPSFGPPPGATADTRTRPGRGVDLTYGKAGSAPRAGPPGKETADITIISGQPTEDWQREFVHWAQERMFYPEQAVLNQEDGTAVLRLTIDRLGHIKGLELVTSSGSQWLDLAGQSMFRNQTTIPFPPDILDPEITMEISLHYILIR